MQHASHVKIEITHFYPEEFRRKIDAEKYSAKGTCAVNLELDAVEIEVKNITYRIDHDGKVMLKPPFRIHSNKKQGVRPKLVPSIVFKDSLVWKEIEDKIRSAISIEKNLLGQKKEDRQLDLWENGLITI